MNRSARSVATFYLASGTFLLVVAASLVVLHQPIDDIAWSAGVSLFLSWMLTLTIAFAVGTVAAGAVWQLLRQPASPRETTEPEPVAARREHPETTLVTIR